MKILILDDQDEYSCLSHAKQCIDSAIRNLKTDMLCHLEYDPINGECSGCLRHYECDDLQSISDWILSWEDEYGKERK